MTERKDRELKRLIYFRGAQIPDFEANALQELEVIVQKQFLLSNQISWHTSMNFSVKNNCVVEIGLYKCELKTLPESISNLRMLRILDLRYNNLENLPESIGNLTLLEYLYINNNELTTLPESIGKLESLKTLWLDLNRLIALPESIGSLVSLENLSLNENKLTTLPRSIIKLSLLQNLNIWNNNLEINQNPMIKNIIKALEMNGVHIFYNANNDQSNEISSFHSIGDYFFKEKKYNEAMHCYEKVLEQDPNNLNIWANLSEIYYYIDDFDKEIECCKRLIKLDSKNNEWWNKIGLAYLGKSDYKKAINSFKKAIDLDPKDEIIWFNLGCCYDEKTDYDKAINCYEKVIELNPNYEDAWYALGDAYFEINKYDKAIMCYGKLCDMYEWYSLGNKFFEINEYNKAIECYEEVINLDPSDDESWYNIGMSYYKNKEFDLAIKNLRGAFEINPENFNAGYMIGMSYLELKLYDNVINLCKNLMETNRELYFDIEFQEKIKTLKNKAEEKKDSNLRQVNTSQKFVNEEIRNGDWSVLTDNFKDSLDSFEKTIRIFLKSVLTQYKKDWWECIPKTIQDETLESLEKQKKRDESLGEFGKIYDKIDFFEFSRYIDIITGKNNWDKFSSIFHNRNQLIQFFNEISCARNPVAHHRDLDKETIIICQTYIKRILSFIKKWENSMEK